MYFTEVVKRTLVWVAEDWEAIIAFCFVCWLVIYPIYKWLISDLPMAIQIMMVLILIGVTIAYGVWIEENNLDNGTSGHGYLISLVLFPFTVGFLMNFLVRSARSLMSRDNPT